MRTSNSEDAIISGQVNEEARYLQKTENDFINLLRLSEPLDNFQISELLKLSEFSKL